MSLKDWSLYRPDHRLSEGRTHHVEARDGHVEHFLFVGCKRHDHMRLTPQSGTRRFRLHETSPKLLTQSVEGVVPLHVL